MQPRIRYTTAPDGVRIAYTVEGHGPALVYMPASILGSPTLLRQQPGMDAYFERLAARRTVVQIDLRGYGLSTRGVADRSLEAFRSDVEAVLEAVGVNEVSFLTGGHRASVAIRFAAAHPARVRRMLFGNPIVYDAPATPAPGVVGLMRDDYPLWLEMNAARIADSKTADERVELVRFFRACIEPEHLLAEIKAGDYFDDWRLAETVACPVLVTCKMGTSFWEMDRFSKYAATFPRGEFQEYSSGASLPLFGDSRQYERLIETFFSETGEGTTALSAREMEVAARLAAGDSNAEIAAALCLSVRTVERHLTNIYTKIGARGRADAVAWAVRHENH